MGAPWPGFRILCPLINAERIATPTTVEVIAFPARSCNSRCVSRVSRSRLSGKPCNAKDSRPQRGPPLVEIYGIPAGVMHPTIPGARTSISRSIPCESSMHLLIQCMS
ncbi:uncharacterized protein AKAW2_60869A [Aspergillus luchuensis]|uniref:Uncharacterized protein n=1 Tax=Aspergillus kawachii TaxID=1069201 RepID=A0A7R8A1X1_ASPKA|nr:uncharacterized protein AKAW2_60869A [Aspergillus luchuensis]BCS02606.1 hypothetical protein AKAW2_60869A [Aspergillus luchuensis]